MQVQIISIGNIYGTIQMDRDIRWEASKFTGQKYFKQFLSQSQKLPTLSFLGSNQLYSLINLKNLQEKQLELQIDGNIYRMSQLDGEQMQIMIDQQRKYYQKQDGMLNKLQANCLLIQSKESSPTIFCLIFLQNSGLQPKYFFIFQKNRLKAELDLGQGINPTLKNQSQYAIYNQEEIYGVTLRFQKFLDYFSEKVIIKSRQYQINRQLKNKILLSSLYPISEPILFNFSKFNYFHSLVPELNVLKNYKKIVFYCSKIILPGRQRVHPENKINTHLFKPFYTLEADQIGCYVASKEVMKHTLVALFHVHQLMCSYLILYFTAIKMIIKSNSLQTRQLNLKQILILETIKLSKDASKVFFPRSERIQQGCLFLLIILYGILFFLIKMPQIRSESYQQLREVMNIFPLTINFLDKIQERASLLMYLILRQEKPFHNCQQINQILAFVMRIKSYHQWNQHQYDQEYLNTAGGLAINQPINQNR